MEVDVKDLQAQAQVLCDTTTGDKAKDYPLFHKIKLIWNTFNQKNSTLH